MERYGKALCDDAGELSAKSDIGFASDGGVLGKRAL